MRLLGWLWMVALGMGAMTFAMMPSKAESGWPPKTFPIGFWCGPPEPFITVEQYKKIAEAGFTVVLPPCEGEATVARNLKILDTAKATGLKVILGDARIPLAITGNPMAEANLKAVVADYRRHPALLGYFLTDEPGANGFAGLAEVVAALRKLDPDHLAYINLFPNYASTDRVAKPSQLNTESYDEYLDKYLQTVQPDVLSWDHYHFLTNGDRPGFFGNLYSAQRAASATSPPTPFWQIVLSVQHGPYRPLKEAELRYEAMQTLVFGGQGLLYFTYWLPNDPTFQWSHAIRNRDGTPGPLYEAVKKVNQEVKALTKWLYRAQTLRTFMTGDVPPDGRGQPDDLPIKVPGKPNLTVGAFRAGVGYFYCLVTNRDYEKGVTATVLADAGSRVIERLDLATNKWKPVTGPKDSDDMTTLTLELDAAGAALIRWK